MAKEIISVQIHMAPFAYGSQGVEERRKYSAALLTEIESAADYADDFEVAALCITGSNPLQYHGTGLADIIKKTRDTLSFQQKAEITVNALPGSVTYSDLLALRNQGVNHISFDMYSFIESELEALDRTYAARAIEVFMRMVQQKLTFFNYDVTLYYGLPGQTVESFASSIENAIRYMSMHITVKPYKEAIDKKLLGFYHEALNIMGLTNFEQYTPHHFARPGYASRWNRLAYSNQPSLGFGAGASWKIDGMYCINISDPASYIAARGEPSKTVASIAVIEQNMIETGMVMDELFNLRSCPVSAISDELQSRIASLCRLGLLSMDGNCISLTPSGKANWQAVSSELVV